MKIGELFVELGITGSDKTIGAIAGVKSGLKDTASVSLEAKAAIVGAMYALQQLFSTSNKAGTDLTNFNAQLGVSAQTLQQYQYAAQQVGVSNQEMASTFKGLQATMTKTLMNGDAPKGLARVAQLTGGIDTKMLDQFAKQPQLLIQKLQEYAQKETNAGLRNEVLKSFGVSDAMTAALRRKAFTPEVLAKAPTYSDRDIASLDKANAAWANLGTKIEMAVGKFNAQHGGQLVQDISLMTDKVLQLAEAFTKLAEKMKLFEWIGKAFQGWAMIFDTITTLTEGEAAAVGSPEKTKSDQLKQNMLMGAKGGAQSTVEAAGESFPESGMGKLLLWMIQKSSDLTQKSGYSVTPGPAPRVVPDKSPVISAPAERSPVQSPFAPKVIQGGGQNATPVIPPTLKVLPGQIPSQGSNLPMPKVPVPNLPTPKDIAPKMPATAGNSGNQVSITNQFDQTFNFDHNGVDPQRTGDSVKQSVSQAFRQNFAQSQWS